MTNENGASYLEPTQEAGAALFSRGISGEVVMLNLVRLRDVADYSQHPKLCPKSPISGKQAFQKYIDHTKPYLHESGGDLLFLGEGGSFFIGPSNEQWDIVMMVRQKSLQDFLAFASNEQYLAGIGHRTAAALDSRLLPAVEAT
jgi:uncharacterized protein (DUF1330 family)